MSKNVKFIMDCLFMPKSEIARCQYEQIKNMNLINLPPIIPSETNQPPIQPKDVELFTNGMTLLEVLLFASDM